MANQISLKNSAVANTKPTTGQLVFGELAINTHDARVFFKTDNGSGPVISEIGASPIANTIFVQTTGNDSNSGTSWETAVATIEQALVLTQV
jgi:hypothetical protein